MYGAEAEVAEVYARKGLANLQPRRSKVYIYGLRSTVLLSRNHRSPFPIPRAQLPAASSFQIFHPRFKMPDAQDLANVTYSTAEVRLTTELFHYFIVRGRSTSMLRKEIDDGEVSV